MSFYNALPNIYYCKLHSCKIISWQTTNTNYSIFFMKCKNVCRYNQRCCLLLAVILLYEYIVIPFGYLYCRYFTSTQLQMDFPAKLGLHDWIWIITCISIIIKVLFCKQHLTGTMIALCYPICWRQLLWNCKKYWLDSWVTPSITWLWFEVVYLVLLVLQNDRANKTH